MIALLFLGLFASAPMADGAFAFGHVIAITLSDQCPLWPYQIAIAGARMSRVDSISG